MILRMLACSTCLGLGLVTAPALGQRPTEGEAASLAAIADDWAQQRDFNGVILAVREGEVIFSQVQGIADPDTGRPLDLETRFQTGSVEKYFAAIAVFALVDSGHLDLDAPLSDYLPDYRADTGGRLTLRAILSNQSGLPNDILQAFRAGPATVDTLTVSEAVSLFASGDLQFEPGARFDYVLSNWLLVQHLLEVVSGLSYPEVRQRYVFEPAGMQTSGGYIHDLHETDPETDNVAIGFVPGQPDARGDYWAPAFFKGSYTTAGDLLRLEHALEDGLLLSEAGLAEFRSIQADEADYAYGGRFRSWELCGTPYRISTQSGSNGASNITSAYVISAGYGVAMATNVDESQGAMFQVSAEMLEVMLGCADD